jgi:hypothetical protein
VKFSARCAPAATITAMMMRVSDPQARRVFEIALHKVEYVGSSIRCANAVPPAAASGCARSSETCSAQHGAARAPAG